MGERGERPHALVPDHAVHETARNTYMGCAGFYIARDPAEDSIPIPRGRYDVPLLLRDALFARDGC